MAIGSQRSAVSHRDSEIPPKTNLKTAQILKHARIHPKPA